MRGGSYGHHGYNKSYSNDSYGNKSYHDGAGLMNSFHGQYSGYHGFGFILVHKIICFTFVLIFLFISAFVVRKGWDFGGKFNFRSK